jgi:transcription termination factor Rho
VSTESETLQRETLEKKSKDQLYTIADTLGLKPSSRARKSELVEAIMRHAGLGDDGDSSAASVADRSDLSPSGNGSTDGDATRSWSVAGETATASNGSVADASGDNTLTESGGPGAEGASRSSSASTPELAVPTPGDPQGEADGAAEAAGGSGARAADDGGTVRHVVRRRRVGPTVGYSASPGDDAEMTEGAGSWSGASDRPAAVEGSTTDSVTDHDQYRPDQGGDQDRTEQHRSDPDRPGQGRTEPGQGEVGGTANDQRDDSDGAEVAEPGNRRRRRRGRDRDRERVEREDIPQGEPIEIEGILDLRDEGYGFVRTKGFLPTKDDIYISAKQARQLGLRKGDILTGLSRPASRSEKNPAMLRIDKVNGKDPEEARNRPRFEDLTPLFPDEKLNLELPGDPLNTTARIIDLISPIGKGQRGLIVSPPKAGKTTIMKQIAQSIEANNPEVHLIVALVDERPEEVTDMRRSIQGNVVASTFDRPSEEHTQVAELTIERAKRMVEEQQDVVIILDGITRLARAYNLAAPATGRIMSGGVDSGALYPPKKFFGAARNIEEGGSLTILATALIETGSKMDEVIFEEFKGTGNMELRLDRRLAERRIYPAIDVDASSTRHEELLFERKQLQQVWKLRRVLSGLSGGDGEGRPGAGLELLLDRLKTFRSNDDFLAEIAKAPSM